MILNLFNKLGLTSAMNIQYITMCIVILAGMAMPLQIRAEIDDFEGYQGLVEAGYTFGSGDFGLNSIDVTTSHGIQVIPTYLFTGIGAGLQYYHESDKCAIPLFADVRSCFMPEENVSPFVDLKVGYAAVLGKRGDIADGGFFLNPMLGCTFVVKDFVALNAGIGYTFEYVNITAIDKYKNIGGFSVRIGVQF